MCNQTLDLCANKRVPFVACIPEMGVDYTGATITAEIRAARGDQGTALITLGTTVAPDEGVSVTYDANFVDPTGVSPNGASLFEVRIAEATLEALPYATPAAKDLTLYYDIHVEPVGGTKFVLAGGEFIVAPGVTL